VELVFKAWENYLQLATLTTTTKNSTLCSLHGRMWLGVVYTGNDIRNDDRMDTSRIAVEGDSAVGDNILESYSSGTCHPD